MSGRRSFVPFPAEIPGSAGDSGGGGSGSQTTVKLNNGLNSNIPIGSFTSIRIIGPTGAFSAGGFTPGTAGDVLVAINTEPEPITLVNEDLSSTAAWRIDTQTGTSVTLQPDRKSTAVFIYDGTTSRWVLQNIGLRQQTVFDARDYGVIADGSTDCLAQLENAVTAITASGGGTLLMPPGTVVVSNTWTIGTSNVTIVGSAAGQSILQAQASQDFVYVLHATGQSFLTVRDLVIDANKANRHGITNATKCLQFDSCTDCLLENVTGMNTRGLSPVGSGVVIVLQGVRMFAIACKALDGGDAGFLSDGFYASGSYIIYSDCVADTCLDTGFVFENCSYSGGVNLRSNDCGGGIGVSCASNSDAVDNFFIGVVISGAVAPIEHGLFGAMSNTGNLRGTNYSDIIVDCPTAGFPACLFYPNPQNNPATALSGTVHVINGSAAITFSIAQAIPAGGYLEFASQPGILYTLAAPVAGTAGTLTRTYQGATNAATTTGYTVAAGGRIVDTTFNNFQVRSLAPNQQSIYATTADGVFVQGGYMNVDGPIVQTGEGNCTQVLVDGVVGNIGSDSVFGCQLYNVTDGVVRDCLINGGAAMAWGIYAFSGSTEISTPRNRITGVSLIDSEGIGGDTDVQPRQLTDGPVYRNAAPVSAGTGQWPLGMDMLFAGAQLLEDATHPLGWITTTAGVPGTAVFTPYFREPRTVNNAGALNAACLTYVNCNGLGTFLGIAINPQNGDRAGLGFGPSGGLGGIDAMSDGEVKIAGSLVIDMGISSGNYPWAFTLGARLRNNSLGVPALGVGGTDTSSSPALLQVNATGNTNWQLLLLPGGNTPGTPLDGGMCYDGINLSWAHNLGGAMGVKTEGIKATGPSVSSIITPGSVPSLTTFTSGDIAVPNMLVGDLVKVTPPQALDAGFIWCWVPGSAAGTVNVRMFNSTSGTVVAVGRTWSFEVEH
jgi:hypothetical protein